MSGKERDEVMFHDAFAYFSDGEWRLLQDWQRELYRNVMKEIHQALISLGPLIVTTVCSLRGKENEEPYPLDNQYADRKLGTSHSPRFSFPDPETDLGKKEEAVSIFIDHLGAEIEECRANANSGASVSSHHHSNIHLGASIIHTSPKQPIFDDFDSSANKEPEKPAYEMVSFHIKDEDAPYCMDYQMNAKIEKFIPPTGNGTGKRMHKVGDYGKPTGKATRSKVSPGSAKVKMARRFEKEAHSAKQLWSEVNNDPGGLQTTQCESAVSDPTHAYVQQGTPNIQTSERFNEWASDWCAASEFACSQNIRVNRPLYSCTECEKTFSKREYLMRHKTTHMTVKPYQCNECEKSFRKKDNLFVHKRTHTGERPYHCSVCEKSFNQKGVLNRHNRIHMGVRPYKCNQCGKSFTQSGTLIAHQRTHNHPKN